MRAAWLLFLAAGCNQLLGIDDVTFGAGDDEPMIDARPATTCADWSYQPAHGIACQEPTGATLAIEEDEVYDSSAGVLTPGDLNIGDVFGQFDDTPAMVIVVDSLSIAAGAVLTIRGTRPVIFQVHGDAVIDGEIDVSAPLGTSGPGALLVCGAADIDGVDAPAGVNGGGGGGGGSFGLTGGDGGAGMNGAGGIAGGEYDVLGGPLVGGCTGGVGGKAMGATPTSGGGGGGGIQISARDAVILRGSGAIRGGGSAGNGGCDGAGGGGGGSGGLIWLEAPSVQLNGTLCANGGSGGEGSANGQCGATGRLASCDDAGAIPDDTLPSGGNGGQGGALINEAGDGMLGGGTQGAGGGGGGAVGYNVVRGTMTGSPVLTSPMILGDDL